MIRFRTLPALALVITLATHDASAQEKSPGVAFGLSFGSTVAPPFLGLLTSESRQEKMFAIAIATALVGPSVGHFYAAQPGRAFRGIGIRVGITAGAWAWALAADDQYIGLDRVGIGSLVLGAAAIVDVFLARGSATKTNEERGLVVEPSVASVGDGVGLGIRLRFRR